MNEQLAIMAKYGQITINYYSNPPDTGGYSYYSVCFKRPNHATHMENHHDLRAALYGLFKTFLALKLDKENE